MKKEFNNKKYELWTKQIELNETLLEALKRSNNILIGFFFILIAILIAITLLSLRGVLI